MSNELMVCDRSWLTLKNSSVALPKPFSHKIQLGEYNIRGLVHLDNPSVLFSSLRRGMTLELKINHESCEVLHKGVLLGSLPPSEGRVFVGLMRGGKRLVAEIVDFSASGLEPKMTVEVIMEEM